MAKSMKKSSNMRGLAPGELIHIGEKKTDKIKVTLIDYNEQDFQEKEITNIEECFPFKDKKTVTWINIDGLHDIETIEKIGNCYDIHPLVLEHILNTDQRPKIEDYESYIFFVIKMLYLDEKTNEIMDYWF